MNSNIFVDIAAGGLLNANASLSLLLLNIIIMAILLNPFTVALGLIRNIQDESLDYISGRLKYAINTSEERQVQVICKKLRSILIQYKGSRARSLIRGTTLLEIYSFNLILKTRRAFKLTFALSRHIIACPTKVQLIKKVVGVLRKDLITKTEKEDGEIFLIMITKKQCHCVYSMYHDRIGWLEEKKEGMQQLEKNILRFKPSLTIMRLVDPSVAGFFSEALDCGLGPGLGFYCAINRAVKILTTIARSIEQLLLVGGGGGRRAKPFGTTVPISSRLVQAKVVMGLPLSWLTLFEYDLCLWYENRIIDHLWKLYFWEINSKAYLRLDLAQLLVIVVEKMINNVLYRAYRTLPGYWALSKEIMPENFIHSVWGKTVSKWLLRIFRGGIGQRTLQLKPVAPCMKIKIVGRPNATHKSLLVVSAIVKRLEKRITLPKLNNYKILFSDRVSGEEKASHRTLHKGQLKGLYNHYYA